MGGEWKEELSVEETNKLRESLGLKPLRVDAAPPPPPAAAAPVAARQDGDSESISVEETNRIRIALGLKPLRTETATGPPAPEDNSFEAQERRAVDNWTKHQDEIKKKAQREKVREEIRKAREKVEREQRLSGKGLADDDDEEDALTWLKKQKKRQKKLAAQMEKNLKEREEEEARVRERIYSSKDLEGLKVGHDAETLGDGAILTLKDSEILGGEEDEDELENVTALESEKLKEKLDSKKRKPEYNPYDDEDVDGTILSKYDDEIDPKKKRKQFTLDGGGGTHAPMPKGIQRQQQISEKLKMIPISLEAINPALVEEGQQQASDYIDPSTIKVKKPKKKKARTQRRVAEDDDDIFLPEDVSIADANGSAMNVDSAGGNDVKPARKVFEQSFVDDEDLSAALAIQRRAALKKQKTLKPEELARKLKEEAAVQMNVDDEEAPGMIIDDTTEFVGSLRAPTATERRAKAAPKPSIKEEKKEESDSEDAEGDVVMGGSNYERSMSPDDGEVVAEPPAVPEITSTGLEEDTTIGIGLAATLSMLKQRQLLDTSTDEEAHRKMSEKELFLAKQRLAQVEAEKRAKLARERDRKSGKFDKMSAREKEEYARHENKLRDQQEARDAAARFKDYKPDVKIEYKDEYGRSMNQKEAFKHLSHQFHGKGSGKQKTEKKLKKIADEKKREAASSLNTEGMATFADTAKKSRTAGVRLM